MMKPLKTLFLICFLPILGWAQDQSVTAQEDELAKKLQNPIASLISVPFQNNFDFGFDPDGGSRWTMNIQPVIPFGINEDWNLITRVILPVISQNDLFGSSGSQTGLSDAVISGFFSPKAPNKGGFTWGVGPVLLVPTATNDLLGTGKFGLGPTAVVLRQAGSYTYGALVNHIWSVAGDQNRADVNTTFFQPFLARNFKGGYALTLNTEITQSWDADATNGAFHISGSKVLQIGGQLAQIAVGPRLPYGNANGAGWGFRAAFTLLFPN